ncbi:MAG: DUF4131 domain-containing protein, partial [Deltaproteobacteria bacterium]|nr:DUF4131 domain-containing protein [Deltaproteobacteria bacterium]
MREAGIWRQWGPTGLAFWEIMALAGALGCLALEHIVPAVVALAGAAVIELAYGTAGRRLLVLPMIFALGLVLANARQESPRSALDTNPPAVRVPVRIMVTDAVGVPGGRYRVVGDEIRFSAGGSWQSLPGRLVLTLEGQGSVPLPGQILEAAFRIRPVRGMANPGVFRIEDHWGRNGVHWRGFVAKKDRDFVRLGPVPDGPLDRLRLRVRSVVEPLSSTGRGLLAALLYGDRSGIGLELLDRFQRASLAHTLALSGLHLGLVASFGFWLALGLGWIRSGIYLLIPRPKLAVIMAAPLVLLYMWLGDFSVTLVRSG